MLEQAINLCPDDLWTKENTETPLFWQLVYHSIYYLDFYLGTSPEKHEQRFAIKENLNERMEQTLSKEELLDYLKDTEKKCISLLESLTKKELEGKNDYYWTGPTLAHRLIYNIRHTQHHIGQLNIILRQNKNKTSKWVITSNK